MSQLTPGFKRLSRISVVIIIVVGLFFGIQALTNGKSKGGFGSIGDGTLTSQEKDDVIKCAFVGFSGYGPLYYMNVDPSTGRADKANKNCRAYKDFGLLIEIKEMNDPSTSIEAWKSDKVDVHWWTADSFAPMAAQLIEYKPKIFINVDKSRGADVAVGKPGIKTISDLRGKTVAYQPDSPSQTFLTWMLKSANMSLSDIKAKQTSSAEEAATLFKSSNDIQACITWSPYDEGCMSTISGSSRICTTKQAPDLIADIMFAKEEFLNENEEKMQKFYDCWTTGAAEINADVSLKDKVADILLKTSPTQQSLSDWRSGIDNVRYCTNGDNRVFFSIDQNLSGLSGEKIYTATASTLNQKAPGWTEVSTTMFVKLSQLTGGIHVPEGKVSFTQATQADINKTEMSSKNVIINFSPGSAALSDEAKSIIDYQFVDLAKAFSSMRIQLEGNTSTDGDYNVNMRLSKMRAQAVAEYLISRYGFDRNRFIIIGNGEDNPVASNDTEDGKAQNRRTEFKLK